MASRYRMLLVLALIATAWSAKDLRIERVALERTLAIAAANYRPPP